MIAVALKGLAQHRLRTVLTALAIVVGVATMTAAFTLSDTMRKGADAVSSSSYDGTAAVVSAKTAFDRSTEATRRARRCRPRRSTRCAPCPRRAWPSAT
jgi:hypothetical protein